MRTLQTTIYKFNELPEEGKEKAIERFRQTEYEHGYNWSDDSVSSVLKFAEHFGCSIERWSFDFAEPHRNEYRIDTPYQEWEEDEVQQALDALGTYDPKTLRGNGECKLTGMCFDEDCIDGFRIEWYKGERDIEELIRAGIQTWETSVQNDWEHQVSDEGITESIECNEYEFTEDGKMV